MTRARILIFAKAPVPGRVKTRLIPMLGAAGAANLAHDMLLATVAQAFAANLLPPELCVDPDPLDPAWRGFLPDRPMRVEAQGDGDLGARLTRAADRTIRAGEKALLIGTDCPALDGGRLRAAALALADHDAVIHPASDGGYALLGLRQFHPSLFDGIEWSTGSVCADTIDRVAALGWSLHVADTLRDVDEPADLDAWRRFGADGLQGPS